MFAQTNDFSCQFSIVGGYCLDIHIKGEEEDYKKDIKKDLEAIKERAKYDIFIGYDKDGCAITEKRFYKHGILTSTNDQQSIVQGFLKDEGFELVHEAKSTYSEGNSQVWYLKLRD